MKKDRFEKNMSLGDVALADYYVSCVIYNWQRCLASGLFLPSYIPLLNCILASALQFESAWAAKENELLLQLEPGVHPHVPKGVPVVSLETLINKYGPGCLHNLLEKGRYKYPPAFFDESWLETYQASDEDGQYSLMMDEVSQMYPS